MSCGKSGEERSIDCDGSGMERSIGCGLRGMGCGRSGMDSGMGCGMGGMECGMSGMDSGIQFGISGIACMGGIGGISDIGILIHPLGMSGMGGATTTWCGDEVDWVFLAVNR